VLIGVILEDEKHFSAFFEELPTDFYGIEGGILKELF